MFMKDIILKNLKEIEEKEKIKILYAVESGSRGNLNQAPKALFARCP